MYHSNSLLIFIICVGMFFLNFPASTQEKHNNNDGFWVNILSASQNDSLTVPAIHDFITLAQIKSLPIHSIQLPDHKTKENITWECVYLEEVLEKFLKLDWQMIHQIIIKAPDSYSSVISGMKMKQAESALCTFSIQGKKWLNKYGYMRIIFPDLHEMHWMNNPTEIELVLRSDANKNRVWKFFFFDSPVFVAIQSNVTKETAEWSVADILTTIGSSRKVFAVFIGDGQWREYLFDEITQKMKFVPESTGTWKIRGKLIPIGFRLRKIFFLYSENIGLFTKSLTPEEQLLWQNLFASIHPFASQGTPATKILLTLASGEKIPSTNFEEYRSGKISLYQLLKMERDAQTDLMEIEANW